MRISRKRRFPMEIDQARVLIIATDGFEQHELFGPRDMLHDLGAEVTLASIEKREIQGTIHDAKGATITATATFDEVSADDYDMLIIPGGVANPDKLRTVARSEAREVGKACVGASR